jgi:hypothetical protein
MDRAEHLSWAKARALEYLDKGALPQAVASLVSDLNKHEAFRGPAYQALLMVGMLEANRGPNAVRRWIEGFN